MTYIRLSFFAAVATAATPHGRFGRLLGGSECPRAWTNVTAADYVTRINPGWNLGNTLDALPNEGSWNNPPVVAKTFDDINDAGFKSVRIPVTYNDHYISGSPNWTIDPAWLQRVSDVVDMATEKGLYVMTNLHHDSWNWADVTKKDANITMIEEKLHASWAQIATKLACKPETVSFETINEPPAETAEHGAQINRFNEIFLRALGSSGGFNSRRVVTLVGGSMDSVKTSQWFVPPKNISNPWALQFHYYSPYDFIFNAWGKTTWGSADDKKALTQDLALIRNNFTDIPLVIGEWGASTGHCETSARQRYFDYFVRAAGKIGAATFLWDNGDDYLDRQSGIWRDSIAIQILANAARGGPNNSLPDGTTDGQATSQNSSAFIYHKLGEEVTDYELPILFNGNTLSSVKLSNGTILNSTSDYRVSQSAVTFKSAFLSRFISTSAAPGSKGNFLLHFSAGAPLRIDIVQWDTPTFNSTSSTAVKESGDLHIAVTYKGLKELATVKMQTTNGTYLFDDWTQNLGPLQRARGTYQDQWDWDDSSVILTARTIAAVLAIGKNTTFTFEFYPRVPENTVNYTLAVGRP